MSQLLTQYSTNTQLLSIIVNFKPESIDVRKPGKVLPANPPRVVDGVALDVEHVGANVSS